MVGVETFYHPLNRIWHDQDGAESTVLAGEWTSTERSDRYHKTRRPLVSIVRSVYSSPVLRTMLLLLLPPTNMRVIDPTSENPHKLINYFRSGGIVNHFSILAPRRPWFNLHASHRSVHSKRTVKISKTTLRASTNKAK